MSTAPLTWEDPPAESVALPNWTSVTAPTLAESLAALRARPGQWAVLARPDRAARALTFVERLTTANPDLEVVMTKVGPEHRVYARTVPRPPLGVVGTALDWSAR